MGVYPQTRMEPFVIRDWFVTRLQVRRPRRMRSWPPAVNMSYSTNAYFPTVSAAVSGAVNTLFG
jgi:hypothetical protein